VRAKVPKIANSDLHAPKQMTSWKTIFECERHPEAILAAIKNQQLRFHFYEDRGPLVQSKSETPICYANPA
jgi:hypothetical protein